jgi:uncharacterized protein
MPAPFSTRFAMVVLVALGLIGIAKPAAAQGPAPAPAPAPAAQPSPTAILLARQLVEIKGVKQMFAPIVTGVIEKAKEAYMQTNFMWQKDLDEVAVNMRKDFDPRSAELVDATARNYASHFTEAELKGLLAFYQSPLGQKMIVEEPKVIDESMNYAGIWADKLSDDVMVKMRTEMKKRGHDM